MSCQNIYVMPSSWAKLFLCFFKPSTASKSLKTKSRSRSLLLQCHFIVMCLCRGPTALPWWCSFLLEGWRDIFINLWCVFVFLQKLWLDTKSGLVWTFNFITAVTCVVLMHIRTVNPYPLNSSPSQCINLHGRHNSWIGYTHRALKPLHTWGKMWNTCLQIFILKLFILTVMWFERLFI